MFSVHLGQDSTEFTVHLCKDSTEFTGHSRQGYHLLGSTGRREDRNLSPSPEPSSRQLLRCFASDYQWILSPLWPRDALPLSALAA